MLTYKLQWNFNHKTKISVQANTFKNVRKQLTILFRPQSVKDSTEVEGLLYYTVNT